MDVVAIAFDIVVYIVIGISIVSMYRLVLGPTPEDRMLGLNQVSSQILIILLLVAVKFERPIYLDVALVYAILGFIGILAVAKYVARRGNRE